VTASLFPEAPPLITVSELNKRARILLENHFESLWVAGELSNVKKSAPGHWYFALKDEAASVDCVIFQSRARFLDFKPEDGQRVEVRGRVTLYEARGGFQLSVDEMRKAGRGVLYEAFEKLKARLEAEGLFDPARKKPLVPFPRRIGIVTSQGAAALRDVLTTLRRRAPMIPVVLYPASVQGDGAAAQVARAIRIANERAEVDVLLVCRGGGSLEDLWSFNEEVVARSIAASRIPVVSGVGHETDFTIADFVADFRAATPTAAAVAATPDREELLQRVALLERRLVRDVRRVIEIRSQRLDIASRRLLTPAERIERSRERLAHAFKALRRALPDFASHRRDNARFREVLAVSLQRRIREHARHVSALGDALTHLDPNQVLARGYSIVRDASGHVRITSDGLTAGDALDVTFSEGGASTTVREPRPR
jgi:exodeoxyribonuclease VII large subunit